MAQGTELTVCFADICGSTALFEDHSDERAREIVRQSLRRMSGPIDQRGGTVVKTLGDGLLSTFPSPAPAARAATEFPESVWEEETLAALGIEVRAGLCHGPVAREEGGNVSGDEELHRDEESPGDEGPQGGEDVHGDVVNTASRLADWAHAGQVVTTGETAEALPSPLQEHARSLGEKMLRGKAQPVEIVELLGEETQSNLTVVEEQVQALSGEASGGLLLLLFGGEERRVRRDPLWIGRGPANDLRVEDPRVSRRHAIVEPQGGSFFITDRSTNGTYVQIGTEEEAFVHHDELRLRGSGRISLGRPAETEDARLIRFECEREPTGSSST